MGCRHREQPVQGRCAHQNVHQLGLLPHDSRQGVHVGVDGIQGALGLGNVQKGSGVRHADGLVLGLRGGGERGGMEG